MYKYAKITLLSLAAFLLLGFSITANAAKPDKEQLVVSAATLGVHFTCSPLNMTDHEIIVTAHLITETGTRETFSEPVLAGQTGWFQWYSTPEVKLVHCAISWVGQPGDIRAAYCSHSLSSFFDAICYELY